MKRVAKVRLTHELLAELLGFRKGNLATCELFQRGLRADGTITIRVEGPDMPECREAEQYKLIDLPQRQADPELPISGTVDVYAGSNQ